MISSVKTAEHKQMDGRLLGPSAVITKTIKNQLYVIQSYFSNANDVNSVIQSLAIEKACAEMLEK